MQLLSPPAYVVRGKVLFSQVSVCSHLGGRVPTFWVGGTYSQVLMGGRVPTQVWVGGGTYLPRSGRGGGVPTQVLMGGYLPWQGKYPPPIRVGTPPPRVGTPPPRVGTPPLHQDSIACACYRGMPLAFTQEDFLVSLVFIWIGQARRTEKHGPNGDISKISTSNWSIKDSPGIRKSSTSTAGGFLSVTRLIWTRLIQTCT